MIFKGSNPQAGTKTILSF